MLDVEGWPNSGSALVVVLSETLLGLLYREQTPERGCSVSMGQCEYLEYHGNRVLSHTSCRRLEKWCGSLSCSENAEGLIPAGELAACRGVVRSRPSGCVS